MIASTITRSDANGVRRSWETAAINPCRASSISRWRSNAASKRSAITLNAAASSANSRSLATGTRAERSPAAICAAPLRIALSDAAMEALIHEVKTRAIASA